MWPAISVSWNKGFSVSVEVKNKSKALLVPLISVVTENDKNYVWIVDDQKKAKKVEVALGNADANNQEITSGLTDGAKIKSVINIFLGRRKKSEGCWRN